MIFTDQIGIVADDLTGANDTALQFQKKNVKTSIILDNTLIKETSENVTVWATSTESRNIPSVEASEKITQAVHAMSSTLNIEHFYKKIDSTLRGNIAIETLSMIKALNMDAAVIIPAFPLEGRITVGGYHLLHGVPIGRTEIAKDPHSPILESHVPTLLQNQLGEMKNLVAHIDLKTVMNGAGPILIKINNLIKEGKKIIVADSISITDIEQTILAINKSNYYILPAGTAATASVLANIWLDDKSDTTTQKIPRLPKLIISGSATKINNRQIEKLKHDECFDKIYEIALTQKDIMQGVDEDMVKTIINALGENNTVLVHSSYLLDNFDGFSDYTLSEELTKTKFAGKITDYLGILAHQIIDNKNVFLVTLGGETSYKCCKAIGTTELNLIDEVLPAIPLCIDKNNQYIITKSGNLGNSNTLIEILKYIDKHEQL